MELPSIESVLVIKPSSLGDVVHTLPAVALMRQQYPELQIGWVVDVDLTRHRATLGQWTKCTTFNSSNAASAVL